MTPVQFSCFVVKIATTLKGEKFRNHEKAKEIQMNYDSPFYQVVKLCTKFLPSLLPENINIPNGNISYSGLHSTIDKDITTYADVYPLQTPDGQRNFDTGELLNRIKVTSETWKYEQQLSQDLKLDLFKSLLEETVEIIDFKYVFSV